MGVKLCLPHFREEYRLRTSENKILWSIFEPKRQEVIKYCRKLHTEGLYNLYSSPNTVRVIK
jgi:hypothetical protein